MEYVTPTVEFIENYTGQKIDQIKTLSLEAMGFTAIMSDVFNKLTRLTSLNLSGNNLTDMPADLCLPRLKELDISDNSIKTLMFAKNLTALQELYTDGNGLESDEKYIVVTICPGLTAVNKYRIGALKKMACGIRDRLWPQVQGVWEESLADKYSGFVIQENHDDVLERFLHVLSKRQLIAPTTNTKYTDFMSKHLAAELVASVCRGNYRKPKKKGCRDTPPVTPGTPHFTVIKSKGAVCTLPHIHNYKPLHFIRCHNGGSKEHMDNDPTDNMTQVWRAAFEPNPHKPGEFTNTVATVGGHNVCLIDCNSGRVMRRYKETGERFFAIAWTTLHIQHGELTEPTNILAVAGERGCVKLLHPQQLVCYHEFEVATKHRPEYINIALFHPTRITHLYCGDSGGIITGWDIGVPSGSNYKTTVTLLFTLRSCTDTVIGLICDKKDHLIAGCEGALLMWNIGSNSRRKTREADAELVLPGEKGKSIDGLTTIGEDMIACKATGEGCIYLWRMSSMFNGKQKATIKVTPMAVLEWVKTETMYLNLGASKDGLLACGDERGRVWLYNVAHLLKPSAIQVKELLGLSRILPWPVCETNTKRTFEALMTDLTDQENTERIVNHVTISPDKEYIVVCTADNMVCVWTCH